MIGFWAFLATMNAVFCFTLREASPFRAGLHLGILIWSAAMLAEAIIA